jgi:plasmid stability protein
MGPCYTSIGYHESRVTRNCCSVLCDPEESPVPTNLTITVEDDDLRRARIRALEQGTSVSAVLREFLRAYAGTEVSRAAAVERIQMLAEGAPGRRGSATWTRDELHERGR